MRAGTALNNLERELSRYNVRVERRHDLVFACSPSAQFTFFLLEENQAVPVGYAGTVIPFDYLLRAPEKVAAIIVSRLQLNKRLFARKCTVQKISKAAAVEFLERFHLMGAAGSAYNLGLFQADQLMAVASFSKGRKMRRLKEDQRSFELIRFCTRAGYTVSGGLSRLLSAFCELKGAAEVMSYVDRQLSPGRSFSQAGFVKIAETPPRNFMISKHTFERSPLQAGQSFDAERFFRVRDNGNIKMLFQCRK